MRWLEAVAPVRMTRIILVAPEDALRDVLVRVADSGTVEIDLPDGRQAPPSEMAARLQHAGQAPSAPGLSAEQPDLDRLEQAGRYDLLAGEAQLEEYAAAAAKRPGVAALAGWIPAKRLPAVAARPAPPTKGQARRYRRAQRGQPTRRASAAATRSTPCPASPNIMPNIST